MTAITQLPKRTHRYLMLLTFLISACTLARTPGLAEPQENPPLLAPAERATPAADSPAAGICGGFDGDFVTITVRPDVPDPRCARVRPSQRLVVVNLRDDFLSVRIGPFESSIPPGGEHLFDLPLGEYLAQGVHQIIVQPCCGAELILFDP